MRAYKSGYYAKMIQGSLPDRFEYIYISDKGGLLLAYIWPGYEITKTSYYSKNDLNNFLDDAVVSGKSLPEYDWVWSKEKHRSDRVIKEGRTFIVYKGDYK